MSKKQRKKNVSKTGLPPGSSVYVGQERSHEPNIRLISYDENELSEVDIKSIQELSNLNLNKYHWIHITGVHNIDVVHKICRLFNLQALTEEDILNTLSRPKSEIFDDYVFTELRIIKNEIPDKIVEDEQLSMVLTHKVLISFQETNSNFFDPICLRLHNTESRARRKGVDYLYCLLMDLIVDTYMDIMDDIDLKTESIEEKIIKEENNNNVLHEIQALKSDLIFLKKVIYPFRESILKVLRSDAEFFKPENMKYFNDLYDHLLFVTDSIDTQREIAVSLRDMYMSTLSNAMNNVMKILTIITSIFIPLSFISGVYGMNFEFMPELHHKHGYSYVLGFMLLVALGMVYYFRRKRWI